MRPTSLTFAAVAPRVAAAALLLAGLLAVAPNPARAEGGDGSIRLRIEDADGGGLSLDLDGWLGALVRTAIAEATVDCEVDVDDEAYALLLELERQGEGGRAEVVSHGKRIRGWRRAGQLELEVREHGDKSRISLPWSLASCALGRHVELDEELAGGRLRIDVSDDDGGRVELRIE